MKKRYRCEACGGNGKWLCDACDATGRIPDPNNPGKTIKCPSCDRKGFVHCESCGGSGYVWE